MTGALTGAGVPVSKSSARAAYLSPAEGAGNVGVWAGAGVEESPDPLPMGCRGATNNSHKRMKEGRKCFI